MFTLKCKVVLKTVMFNFAFIFIFSWHGCILDFDATFALRIYSSRDHCGAAIYWLFKKYLPSQPLTEGGRPF